MTKKEKIQLFEDRKVRMAWDERGRNGISPSLMCVAF